MFMSIITPNSVAIESSLVLVELFNCIQSYALFNCIDSGEITTITGRIVFFIFLTVILALKNSKIEFTPRRVAARMRLDRP